MKLHVNWGRASAKQLKQVLADSKGGIFRWVNCVDEVLQQRETCRASDKAPHVPTAGTSTASMFSEKVQVDLLFLGDITALQDMGMFSKFSLLLPVQSKNPQEV